MDSMYYGEENTEKRNSEGDEASPSKRAGSMSVEEDSSSGEHKVSSKFLISNASAGSIIGKGGVTISEFQAQSGARIQLSRNHEFFPGTTDRILLLTGTVNAILTALHLILSKLLAEEPAGMAENPGMVSPVAASTVVKLVVPSAVCGGIIGKGGSTIRSYVEDSGAHIKLSGQDMMVPGVHERIITITGTLEQQLRAVALIITKMAEDPNFPIHSSVVLSYPSGAQPGRVSPTQGGAMQAFPGAIALAPSVQVGMQVQPMQTGPTTTVTVAVPDEHIGAVVGRGGKYISEMQQVSGVRIKISDRSDYVPGTRNRKVTLTGSLEAVQIAQFLISQKVQQSVVEMQSIPPGGRMS
mmetsp:Transcript_43646/g.72704  ORF Transcript_43646/g.72704 Transcript_43646/m.72704 type:complete len:354 (-) Transcript_43646:553-1614(-)|eukprot:CAMPEP_0198197558 /NCGR_PEP_ID=MMETSP1445-20131203/1129_1 /TAXON_ID=36898 /ORGANISM="Pyramimonas sp., Strain CCMP2087" /LENGTH=353 /DNA_ID=CAMNT_0043866871 /DNA_START=286 /DNA_END=1347 /DNA_ORIENTATION=-